jgi:replication fork protection complex subunit Tof1/Swi1
LQHGENGGQARTLLSSEGRSALITFMESMLESAFNCLYNFERRRANLLVLVLATRRELTAERITITDWDYIRFFTVTSFILSYQLTRHEAAPEEAFGFETVASVVNPQTMAFVVRELRKAEGEKRWAVLQAGLGTFRQIILSLDSMAHSTNEELRQVSEGMQNLLFYEVSTIEFIEHLTKSFKPTTLTTGYLKVLVETVHVLLRSLEKFSKNRPLFVRKEKRVKKSNELQGGVSEDEDERRVYEDKKFDFGVLENRFASDTVISTYCILLKEYQTMEPSLLHQVLKMLYRIAFNTKHEPMLYKLSTMTLFNRILAEKARLPKTAEHKELVAFVTAVVRKFFACLGDYPFLFLDLFFVKTKQDCVILREGLAAVDAIQAKKQPKDAYETNDELEIKPGFTWSQQVRIAVRLLVDDDQEEILNWLLNRLSQAEKLFKSVGAMPFQLTTQDDMIIRAFVKNRPFRLLLDLVNFEERAGKSVEGEPSEGERAQKEWWLKATIQADNLEEYQELIGNSMLDMDEVEGKPAKKHIRKKKELKEKKPREKKPKVGNKAVDSHLSKAVISDSDDSDDEEFFKEEASLRARIALRYQEAKMHDEKPKIPAPVEADKPVDDSEAHVSASESGSKSETEKEEEARSGANGSESEMVNGSLAGSPVKKRRLQRKVVWSDSEA